jgi:hypothetical protein
MRKKKKVRRNQRRKREKKKRIKKRKKKILNKKKNWRKEIWMEGEREELIWDSFIFALFHSFFFSPHLLQRIHHIHRLHKFVLDPLHERNERKRKKRSWVGNGGIPYQYPIINPPPCPSIPEHELNLHPNTVPYKNSLLHSSSLLYPSQI